VDGQPGALKLSVVIPAHNEEGSIERTVSAIAATLSGAGIDYEVLVIDDASTDATSAILGVLAQQDPRIRVERSPYPRGFGNAVQAGLERYGGEAVAIAMGDASERPDDLVRYHGLLTQGYDCAFGSRFLPGAELHGYPPLKLILNRVANQFLRFAFRYRYNDTTNAFKAYRREVIDAVTPLQATGFDLTVELPVRAIGHGFSYAVVPVAWTGRMAGRSKLRLQEVGSRYLRTTLRLLAERRRAARIPHPGRARRIAIWTLVPTAIALLSWSALPLEPLASYGLDDSWQAALHMALHDGVSFGNHFAFPYGPLGFLSVPTFWYTGTGATAAIYATLMRVALAATLLAAARRSFGLLVGVPVTFAVAAAVTNQGTANSAAIEPVVFFIVAAGVVECVSDERLLLAAMAFGGTFAGLELLNKTSVGLDIGVLALIMAIAARGSRRRHLAIVLSSGAAALIIGWVASGQPIGALPAFAGSSIEVTSGYGAAMSYEQPGLDWEYAAAWAAFAIGIAAALEATVGLRARQRAGILALWVAFCFLEMKEGFVRHDADHAPLFFAALLGGSLAFAWRPGRRILGLALLAALFAFTLNAESVSVGGLLRPGPDASSAVTQIGQVLSASKRSTLEAAGRREVRLAYPLDPQTLALLRGHSVDIEPYEADIAWAYRLAWRPEPTIQSYAAYTTALDDDDASALSSSYAPARILRSLEGGIDGRVQSFDAPAATRALLCNYRQLRATAQWQVLGRVPGRCSAPKPLGTVSAGWLQSVAVPAPPSPRSVVFVRIAGVQVGGLERLAALLYKPAIRLVSINGSWHRLIEGNAADGLILRAGSQADFAPPWNLAPDSPTIAVAKAGQEGPGVGRPITFSFFYVTLQGGGAGQ
jgi:dolichol-phosphate mannosyltransferase